jgi:hypothetical protein
LREDRFAKRTLRRRPVLTPKHIADRIAFAQKHLVENTDWDQVVFSDEKKFRWDGPDGYHSFWYQPDDAPPPVPFSRDYHQFRGVMVWGCVSSKGLLRLERMYGSVTADAYVTMLSGDPMAAIHASHGTEFVFQQDNATPHRAQPTQDFLKDAEVSVLEWPALSPDLNPMENVWSMMVRLLYKEGHFYDSDDSLWEAIKAVAAQITVLSVRPLISSMRGRLVNVLSRGGHYAQ